MSAQLGFSRSIDPRILAALARAVWLRGRLMSQIRIPRVLGWLAPPRFDAESESLFWHERNAETIRPLMTALLLGSLCFLAFIVLDIFSHSLSLSVAFWRTPVVVVLFALFLLLHHRQADASEAPIAGIAIIASYLSALDLLSVLAIDRQPEFYAEVWPGLLPVYFLSYGQLVMPAIETVAFGWLTMLAMPLTGWWIGVDSTALMPSALMLVIVNIFGMYTRCQLEIYSRRSFQARRQAELAAEDKTRFLCHVSHNLRQPLQALSCYVSVLEGGVMFNEHCSEIRQIVARAGHTVDELNESFNRILDITHLETGKQNPNITDVNVNLLLEALEDQFSSLAGRRGLKLKIRRRTRPPYLVSSDANMLLQILGNLVDNAIKYTPSGWVLVGTTITRKGELTFHVIDSGDGIKDELRQHSSHGFYRGHRRHTDRPVQGLGIGLDYVYKAVAVLPDHGVGFHSKIGKGTDVRLRLPSSQSEVLSNEAEFLAHEFLQDRYILVVEDHKEVRDALVEELRRRGCLVDSASSLAEVQKLLSDMLQPPDLVITDFYLGERETAPDILIAIHRDFGNVPALILSARGISSENKASLPANTGILRKPVNASVLLNAMRKAITSGEG